MENYLFDYVGLFFTTSCQGLGLATQSVKRSVVVVVEESRGAKEVEYDLLADV